MKRSRDDRIFTGLLGGTAKYLGIDPTLVRIIWLIFMGLTSFIPAIIIYILASLLFPTEKGRKKKNSILKKLQKLF